MHFNSAELKSVVTIGQRHVLPVSLLAFKVSNILHSTLVQQLFNAEPADYDGCFLSGVENQRTGGLSQRDKTVLEQ